MKRSEFLSEFLETEIDNIDALFFLNEEEKNEYLKLLNEFWVLDEDENDKEIVLEDFKAGEGFVYEKLVKWNEEEFIKENELGHDALEYSLEDYCRDLNEQVLEFNEDEVNEMLYYEQ